MRRQRSLWMAGGIALWICAIIVPPLYLAVPLVLLGGLIFSMGWNWNKRKPFDYS